VPVQHRITGALLGLVATLQPLAANAQYSTSTGCGIGVRGNIRILSPGVKISPRYTFVTLQDAAGTARFSARPAYFERYPIAVEWDAGGQRLRVSDQRFFSDASTSDYWVKCSDLIVRSSIICDPSASSESFVSQADGSRTFDPASEFGACEHKYIFQQPPEPGPPPPQGIPVCPGDRRCP